MIDINLFKDRFKKEIINKYGSIGEFARKEDSKLKELSIDLRTIYRWTSTANKYFPKDEQQDEICKILKLSPDYLFPIPQNGLDANYYIGYLEGLLLSGYNHTRKGVTGSASIEDDDEVCNKFWKTVYTYKVKDIYEDIDARWKTAPNSIRPSLYELVFNKLFDDHEHREYLVELALLLVHYMGGKVSLFEDRVKLAEKACEWAEILANEGSNRADYFRLAYYLLKIDALSWIYMETGRASDAVRELEKISNGIDSQRWPNTSALCQIFLARAYLLTERLEDAATTLERIDHAKQITNELVRVRYFLVRGDHLLAQKDRFSADAAFAVYSMGKELQEKLGIDYATSGLGYRLGHACVSMAEALVNQADHTDQVKNTIRDQLLSSAKSIFEHITQNYKAESADQLQALYGLARISYIKKDYSKARQQAENVISQCKSVGSEEHLHIVLGFAMKLKDKIIELSGE